MMDGAIIEDDVIVGAGSLVPPGKRLASGRLKKAGDNAAKVKLIEEQLGAKISEVFSRFDIEPLARRLPGGTRLPAPTITSSSITAPSITMLPNAVVSRICGRSTWVPRMSALNCVSGMSQNSAAFMLILLLAR